MIDGYKTYICAAVGCLIWILWTCGVIDTETALKILTLIATGGLASLRHAVKKLEG